MQGCLSPNIDIKFLKDVVFVDDEENGQDFCCSPFPSNSTDEDYVDPRICTDEFLRFFERSPMLSDILIYKMFRNHILYTIKKNESRQIFIKDINIVRNKYPDLDWNMLVPYFDFIYDLEQYIPNFACNLVGGKLGDFFSGKTLETSTGDYDIWFTDNLWMETMDMLSRHFKDKYVLKEDTGRYIAYDFIHSGKTFQLQIIKDTFETVDVILNNFDLLNCSVGFDGKTFFWKKGALKSIKNKTLFINKIGPTRVLNERLTKYIDRGYTLSFPTMILMSVSTLLGANSIEIKEKLFFSSMMECPEDFLSLRGTHPAGGY